MGRAPNPWELEIPRQMTCFVTNPPTGKSGNFGKFRLVIAPLGSNRSWSASVFVGCLRGAATETDAAKWSSLSQRERAGEREKGNEVSVDTFAPGLRGRSPSPLPSPAGRGDDGGRVAKRGQGVGCPPSRRLPQSQRDCGLQPSNGVHLARVKSGFLSK